MTIITFCSCLQTLKLSEHAGVVAIRSHEVECPFIIAIIQIILIQKFLSTPATLQKRFGSPQIGVVGISYARNCNIGPQMLIIFQEMADQRIV